MQRVDRFRRITQVFLQKNIFQQLQQKQPVIFPTAATFRKLASNERLFSSSSQVKMSYGIVERGCPNSLEYRVFFSEFEIISLIYFVIAELSTALMIYVTLLKYFIFCINDNFGGILGWGGGGVM